MAQCADFYLVALRTAPPAPTGRTLCTGVQLSGWHNETFQRRIKAELDPTPYMDYQPTMEDSRYNAKAEVFTECRLQIRLHRLCRS
jgi:hypothetical protein